MKILRHFLLLSIALMPAGTSALECPPMPQQARTETEVQVNAAVAKVRAAKLGELQVATRTAVKDLMSKLPRAELVYLEQMMLATYCSAVRDDKSLSETERAKRIEAYNKEVRDRFAPQRGPEANPRQSSIGPKCVVRAYITTDVVSRVFYRDSERPGTQVLNPTSQELFYEWNAVLSTGDEAKNIFFELHNLAADDRISIDPLSATVSELQERWISGYKEPHRSRPDFFARTVKIEQLSRRPSTQKISIRRFLAKPLIGSNDLITIKNLGASNCRTEITPDAYAENAARLQSRARTLTKNVNSSNPTQTPVPIRRDPGDLRDRDVQATLEFRCKNEVCTQMNVSNLQARTAKSPYDKSSEVATDKLLALKKDLEKIICIEGPFDDPDPSLDGQFIKMCGEPRPLSQDDMQRLNEIIKRHGFQSKVEVSK